MLQEFREPWAITQDAFRAVLEQSKALMAKDATPVEGTTNVTMRGDVATMHVKGPLFRYHSWYSSYLGSSSYGELMKDLQRCVDAGVKALLFVFDSPGGEVNGLSELADAVFAARSKIPNMSAYVSGTCASAAYFLASAVGPIYCSKTSTVGSIGVITSLYDYSKAMADAGIKEYELVSAQSPNKSQQPADADYRGRIQARIDDMAAVFIQSVSTYRGISPSSVLKQYGQGDAFVGQRAFDAGLVDGMSDVESVIANLQSKVNKTAAVLGYPTMNGAMKMELKAMARLLKLDESASEREIEDRAQALASFERDVLASTDSKDSATAIGKVKAGAGAITERDALKVDIKAQGDAMVRSEFRAVLKAGVKEGRITLGQLSTVIPSFLKDEEKTKAVAALAACKSQDRKELLDAVCTASISAKRLVSVKAFIESSQPNAQAPAAKVEPALSQENVNGVKMVSEKQVRDFGAAYGLAPESIAAFANVNTVEEAITARAKLDAAAK